MDGLYLRVSSERQTTENQFEDVLRVAEKDGYGRDWSQIREALSRCVIEEHRPGTTGTARTVYRVNRSRRRSWLASVCPFLGRSDNRRFGFDNYWDGVCHLNGRISIHLEWRPLVMRPESLTMVAADSRGFGGARALTSSPRSMAAMVALRYHAD